VPARESNVFIAWLRIHDTPPATRTAADGTTPPTFSRIPLSWLRPLLAHTGLRSYHPSADRYWQRPDPQEPLEAPRSQHPRRAAVLVLQSKSWPSQPTPFRESVQRVSGLPQPRSECPLASNTRPPTHQEPRKPVGLFDLDEDRGCRPPPAGLGTLGGLGRLGGLLRSLPLHLRARCFQRCALASRRGRVRANFSSRHSYLFGFPGSQATGDVLITPGGCSPIFN